MLLYIKESRVVGCIIAEGILEAKPVVPDLGLLAASVVVSTTKRKAVIGVNKIWVHRDYRKQSIATRLLDALRFALKPCCRPQGTHSHTVGQTIRME